MIVYVCKSCGKEQRAPIQGPKSLLDGLGDNELRCSECGKSNTYGKDDYFWRDPKDLN